MIQPRLEINLDIKMISGKEETFPYPAFLPIVEHLQVYEFYISILGVDVSIHHPLEFINREGKYYLNKLLGSMVFDVENNMYDYIRNNFMYFLKNSE
jgi:hypothetical protein